MCHIAVCLLFCLGGKRDGTTETELFGDIYMIKTNPDQNDVKGDIKMGEVAEY